MERASACCLTRQSVDGKFLLATVEHLDVVGSDLLHLLLHVEHLTVRLGHRYAGIRLDVAAYRESDLTRGGSESLLRYESDA